MRTSSPLKARNDCAGVTILDLLIGTTVLAIMVSLAVPLMISAQKPLARTNAAQELSSYVQRARSDSKRLHAVAPEKMAQVTILNDRYYFVTLDADGDGVLDPPVVVSLEKRNTRMDGPFPRTFVFDPLGRVFDQNQKLVTSPAVQFSNETGKTLVKFDSAGQPVITATK